MLVDVLLACAGTAQRLGQLGHASCNGPRFCVLGPIAVRQRCVEVALSDVAQDRREGQARLIELGLRA